PRARSKGRRAQGEPRLASERRPEAEAGDEKTCDHGNVCSTRTHVRSQGNPAARAKKTAHADEARSRSAPRARRAPPPRLGARGSEREGGRNPSGAARTRALPLSVR